MTAQCFLTNLPHLLMECSVSSQLGSNNCALLMCFTHNYIHTGGCVSAGTDPQHIEHRSTATLSLPKLIPLLLGLLLPQQ